MSKYQQYVSQFESLAKKEFGGFLQPPKGFYRARIVNHDFISFGMFGSAVVSTVWKGVQFNDDYTCYTVLRRPFSWFIQREIGTVSITKSVLDNLPCINVTFADRFYEMRVIDNGMTTAHKSYLSVVRKKDKANNEYVPLDIHTLTSSKALSPNDSI